MPSGATLLRKRRTIPARVDRGIRRILAAHDAAAAAGTRVPATTACAFTGNA
jgi:hypothetical protein